MKMVFCHRRKSGGGTQHPNIFHHRNAFLYITFRVANDNGGNSEKNINVFYN